MRVLTSTFDLVPESAPANREGNLERIAELERQQALAQGGGGEKYVKRHRSRGTMLVRERIEILLDEGASFLELSTVAGWGTEYTRTGSELR